MLATISSGALQGVQAQPVQVEVNTDQNGDLRFVLVGLPDAAVKESQDRVLSALSNSGFAIPVARTTINLAPGHLRKEGPLYDLPIALGILAASFQMKAEHLDDYLVAGELSLSGSIRPIRGALALALLARQMGKKAILLPQACAQEAAWVQGLAVYGVETLSQTVRFLTGKLTLTPLEPQQPQGDTHANPEGIDFSEIKGQYALKRAVEVAVAGGHNLLMIGPPGSGKSMIAKRIATVMPDPTMDEFLEILSIQSAAGSTLQKTYRYFQRPFRAPHHTISDVGLLGGGAIPGPGEISLAHHGVLFLDELPEFRRSTLEVLRQPLEDGTVSISRSAGKIVLPCAMMLVAAMNPCPCGYLGDRQRECRCSSTQVQRYRSRISGPLLDRIDIHIDAPALSIQELRDSKPGEPSAVLRQRITQARGIQAQRFAGSPTHCNARMSHSQIQACCAIGPLEAQTLQRAMQELNLSARAYSRILKVARTCADLEGAEQIELGHLLEAIQYRSLDRTVFV
jgi:magnesium chelatase family protein